MLSPDTIKSFQTQISKAEANLDVIDKKIQESIEKAQQAGDVDNVMKLSALGSELKALKNSLPTQDTVGDDAELKRAAETLGKINTQMDSIMSKNNKTAALISNVSDLITNISGFISPTNPTDTEDSTDTADTTVPENSTQA